MSKVHRRAMDLNKHPSPGHAQLSSQKAFEWPHPTPDTRKDRLGAESHNPRNSRRTVWPSNFAMVRTSCDRPPPASKVHNPGEAIVRLRIVLGIHTLDIELHNTGSTTKCTWNLLIHFIDVICWFFFYPSVDVNINENLPIQISKC